MKAVTLLFLVSAFLIGFGSSPASSASTDPHSKSTVFIVGDESAKALAHSLQSAGLHAEAGFPNSPDAFAILAQDSTQGILPVHKQAIAKVQQSGNALVMVVFTRTDLVDDIELLELEELEMRDHLTSVGIDGDAMTVSLDSENAPTNPQYPQLLGMKQIKAAIDSLLANKAVSRTP